MSTPEKLKYPYTWGRGVVNTFVEKYPRGTYNLAKVLDIAPGEVRHELIMRVCADNQLRYEALKRVIKSLEDYAPEDLKRLGRKGLKALHRYLVLMGEDSALFSKSDLHAIDDWQQSRLIL